MRKVISLTLVCMICFIGTIFTGCGETKPDISNQVKTDVYKYYEDLKTIIKDGKDASAISSSLKDYFKKEKFTSKVISGDNIVIELKATKGYSKVETNILQTEFDKTTYKKSAQSIAVALATLKNSSEHSKIKLIVSPKENGVSIGTKALSASDLKVDNIINLTYWSKTKFFNGSAGTKVYDINKSFNEITPEGDLAYTIKIADLMPEDSGDRTEKHTNPITTIANFLSNARSSSLNVELASFSSQGSITNYPTGASATFVVDKSMETKFESKLENLKESFEDKNRERDSGAALTYAKTKLPSKVLSYDDTADVLGLLYIAKDGVFATTEEDYEGDTLGITTIAKVSVGNGKSDVKILGRSIDEATLTNMYGTFKNLAKLADFKISVAGRYPLWIPKEDNKFIKEGDIEKAFGDNDLKPSLDNMFIENPSSYIIKKAPKSNLIIIGVNIDDSKDIAMSLITFFKEQLKSQ